MISFFGAPKQHVFAVETDSILSKEDVPKLEWLFGNQALLSSLRIDGFYLGPRATMVSPWSTNAVEITQNMGITGVKRIEKYSFVKDPQTTFDPMLKQLFSGLNQSIFVVNVEPESIQEISDIASYNESEGLALSKDEVEYLNELSERLDRPLTDSEVFGFSQVNSEHCRHKIFNGTFVIDGEEKEESLFKLIKKTSKVNPNHIVSAYKDNVAFIDGPEILQFAPASPDVPDYYEKKEFKSVISLKAETHNFPTTVEPFNGAATGSGGEIRDRLAGGKGSIPMAGTALYMTSYSRLAENRPWEDKMVERSWLYQTPMDILMKASNGASDFGNKFGQPLINGSLLTFEHAEDARRLGFDKVIMLAGGIGYAKKEEALKDTPSPGDKIVILGGDNYRIGMGGASVSSADTGEFSSGIELNAIQRSNPEMQKRVAETIKALVESGNNKIVSIHDHGAGGHLNCLSELVEETGGQIDLDALPIGDQTLSAKEIIGNESQERMGLVIKPEDLPLLRRIAERERAPMFVVGEVRDDHRFSFVGSNSGQKPMDLALEDMFGSSPKTIMDDHTVHRDFVKIAYESSDFLTYVKDVLRLESVACKDWLTNKVDRCVGGRVAKQQCCGPLQLPLNNCGVMALDFDSNKGIATSMGHAPISGLINAGAGARNSIAEALTNLIWAPLEHGLAGVSLSANWMWPCNNEGEDSRLYEAVKAVSDFSIDLGINVPTGKDSLSMKQKYPDGDVLSPGTVVISAVGQCDNIRQVVEPVFQKTQDKIYYLDFSKSKKQLGGSSFAQVRNAIGNNCPDVLDVAHFKICFELIQKGIKSELVCAGHDISSGGLITCLLEMCFSDTNLGATITLDSISNNVDLTTLMFAENAGVVIQAKEEFHSLCNVEGVELKEIGQVNDSGVLEVSLNDQNVKLDIGEYRDIWYETSYLHDERQSGKTLAKARYTNYKNQALRFSFPDGFDGLVPNRASTSRPKAAIIREKGSNSEKEMAHAMYLAGFDVKDVHMTDLISGRETLDDVQFIGAVGGFSNSDVLGSAKGWAGAFKYNEKAKKALDKFFAREDVLSIGICNGCQLFVELDLINPEHDIKSKMGYNDSHKHESAFTSVEVQTSSSIMMKGLEGSTLGVWISHGEGKFILPKNKEAYQIPATYGYSEYPSNPNGSDYNAAMICSADGRHLATMPHIERSIFRWNWAYYSENRKGDIISPWIKAFINAREWIESYNSGIKV